MDTCGHSVAGVGGSLPRGMGTGDRELGGLVGSSPFVEGSGTLLLEHGEGTVASAAVLARGRVHVSRLDHVHGRGDDGGAEARPEGGREVAGKVICQRGGRQGVRRGQAVRMPPCRSRTDATRGSAFRGTGTPAALSPEGHCRSSLTASLRQVKLIPRGLGPVEEKLTPQAKGKQDEKTWPPGPRSPHWLLGRGKGETRTISPAPPVMRSAFRSVSLMRS